MRKLFIPMLAIASITVMAGPAQAAVTFHAGPTFTDRGTTLNVTGDVSGLGNDDLDVTLVATGTGAVTCTNPAGNVAPGQRTTVNASGTQTGIEPKNGRAVFDVTTAEPADPDPAVVCPNRKWDATITDVDFTSATLVLEQDGEVVFSGTFPLS